MRLHSLINRPLTQKALPALLGALVSLGCSTEAEPGDGAGVEEGAQSEEIDKGSPNGGNGSDDTSEKKEEPITEGSGGSGTETEDKKTETEEMKEEEKQEEEEEEKKVEEKEKEEVETSNATASLWYLLTSEERSILSNILSPEDQLVITDIDGIEYGLYPWSPDGTIVAQVVDDEVVFYSLEGELTVLASYPAEGYTNVYAWVPGVGPLLTAGEKYYSTNLGVMKPDGTLFDIAESTADIPIQGMTIAPDGSEVLWGLGNTGPDDSYDLWHQSFDDGEPGESSAIGEHGYSPPLSVSWDSTNSWVSFGIAAAYETGLGGIFVWKRGLAETQRVSPEGSNYNPFFSFSADDSLLVLQANFRVETDDDSLSSSSYLVTVPLGEDEVGESVKIPDSDGVSPSEWSTIGSYLLYQTGEGGVLQEINADGSAEAPIAYPDYSSACPIHWVSETMFVANSCDGGPQSGTLVFSSIESGSIESEMFEGLYGPEISTSADGSCLLTHNDVYIDVGPLSIDDYEPHHVPTEDGIISLVEIAPDASNIIWTEYDIEHYRIELVDCVPQGDPILIGTSETPVTDTTLVGTGSDSEEAAAP